MPGSNDRKPSHVDAPPASRVGDELQQRAEQAGDAELSDEDIRQIEDDAMRSAKEKQWDQQSTAREGREAARKH